MKRILKLLTSSLLGLFLLMPLSPVLALSKMPEPADFAGGCLVYPTDRGTIDGGNLGTHMTRPTKDKITDITIWGEYQAIFEITVYLQKKIDENTVAPPIAQKSFKVTTPAQVMTDYTAKLTDLNLAVQKGAEYQITIVGNSGTFFWKNVPFDTSCDPTGYSTTSNTTGDMAFMFQGTDNATPATPATPATNTAVPAKTVAPSILGVPINFRLDRDLETEKIFAWDKNTEAALTGYVMYIYDGETLVETIDIPDRELDNYNLALADHPLLVKDKEYTAKLSAKTAEGVSEKTEGVLATFATPVPQATVVVSESEPFWLTNPYVLGGLGLLLLLLIGLLIYLEKKYHGLANLFKKSKVNGDTKV